MFAINELQGTKARTSSEAQQSQVTFAANLTNPRKALAAQQIKIEFAINELRGTKA